MCYKAPSETSSRAKHLRKNKQQKQNHANKKNALATPQGTLTTNQMSAVCLVAFGSGTGADLLRTYEVQGHSFDPDEGRVVGLPSELDAGLEVRSGCCRFDFDKGGDAI